MKPKYKLRPQSLHSVKASNKCEAILSRRFTNTKNQQISDAVKYCLDNGVRGRAAFKTGNFPLIKDREERLSIDAWVERSKQVYKIFSFSDFSSVRITYFIIF